MFRGANKVTLDAKGRMAMPARYRDTLVERSEGSAFRVTQTRARHILLRPSEQLNEAAIRVRLAEFKRQIESGARRFEDLAREFSLDGSAAAGGTKIAVVVQPSSPNQSHRRSIG